MYRKKPVVVEAWQWTPPAWIDMPQWLLDAIDAGTCCCHQSAGDASDMVVTINTLEGMMTAQSGDWIIKGIKGEIYPCKPDIFAATYEPAAPARLPDEVDTSDIPEASAEWFEKASYSASKVEAMPPGVRADAMQQAEIDRLIDRLNAAIRLRDEQITQLRGELEQVNTAWLSPSSRE